MSLWWPGVRVWGREDIKREEDLKFLLILWLNVVLSSWGMLISKPYVPRSLPPQGAWGQGYDVLLLILDCSDIWAASHKWHWGQGYTNDTTWHTAWNEVARIRGFGMYRAWYILYQATKLMPSSRYMYKPLIQNVSLINAVIAQCHTRQWFSGAVLFLVHTLVEIEVG